MNKETLEEAAEKYGKIPDYMSLTYLSRSYAFIEGAKWQAKRMYSREDMIQFAKWVDSNSIQHSTEDLFEQWVKLLKKKS